MENIFILDLQHDTAYLCTPGSHVIDLGFLWCSEPAAAYLGTTDSVLLFGVLWIEVMECADEIRWGLNAAFHWSNGGVTLQHSHPRLLGGLAE